MAKALGEGPFAERALEVSVWLAVSAAVVAATLWRESSCTGVLSCTLDMVHDRELWVRCALSMPIACALYLSFGFIANAMFPRTIVHRAGGTRPPVYSWWRFDGDINWSIMGLLAGTPLIQLVHHASDKYGQASGMRLYKDPLEHGWVWAFAQVPVYLVLWDLVFYVLHRFVLHNPFLYRYIHGSHHSFRPPTAWAGIAVGPLDVIFEGILPYALPLFFGFPFHEYTVNAINAILTFHACVLHSSCHRQYGEISGWLGWLMISPIGHNMHHNFGERNACNFAPIFKIWDHVCGTLNEGEPSWWANDRKVVAAAAAKAKASAKESVVDGSPSPRVGLMSSS